MLITKWIVFILGILDCLISTAQPLAPRNRNKRRPVIETFSGCRCVYCIQSDPYCRNLFNGGCPFTWINYHAGPFALPKDSISPDLRTQCGTSIHDSLHINLYPSAFINRIFGPLTYTSWSAIHYVAFNAFASVSMGMETRFDSMSKITEIEIELYRFDDYLYDHCHLSVFLIEDDVVSPQIVTGNIWDDHYKHPFVFRSSISSCFGDRVDSLAVELS